MTETAKNIYLTGDAGLVREFGGICLRSGIGVECRTASGETGALPRGFKIVPSVPKKIPLAAELTNLQAETKRNNIVALDRNLPPSVPILTSSVTVRVSEQATWIKHPSRLIGFGAFPTLLSGSLIEMATALTTDAGTIESASHFFAGLGKEISVVEDRAALVMPRILCSIINEAFFALTENIATPGDIDSAMKLGAKHPRGPVEWADLIGIPQIVAVLDALRKDTGEERYRVAPLLRQMSFSPHWWKK